FGKERQPRYVDAETGSRDDVVRLDARLPGAVNMEPHSAPVRLGRPEQMASQHLDYALDAIAEPPRTFRAESGQRLADPDGLGQPPECVRGVVAHTRPSLAQFRRRPPNAVKQPDLRCYRLFPGDLLPADNDLDVGACLVQQRPGLQRGLAAADHGHSP